MSNFYKRAGNNALILDQNKTKYGNKKVTIDGYTFDSIFEGQYYGKLKMLKLAGQIKDFKMQVPFPVNINGKHVFKYIADFVVTENDNTAQIHEVKGYKTDVYKLKKKCIEAYYNIKIKEIRK